MDSTPPPSPGRDDPSHERRSLDPPKQHHLHRSSSGGEEPCPEGTRSLCVRLRRVDPASDSLERLVPTALDAEDSTGQATLELHLARYNFAAEQLRPGRVLDIACGVGYGSQLLSQSREEVSVLGVDSSELAIGHARENYAGPNVEFRRADAMSFDDPEGFDSIVSLETLEHVPAPGPLLEPLVSLLRPQGVLIASVPTTPSVDLNPHHLHDFSEASFRSLVEDHTRGLREISAFRQRQQVSLIAVLRRQERRMSDLRKGLIGYYSRHPDALLRRIGATVRFGLCNRYATLVWQFVPGSPE